MSALTRAQLVSTTLLIGIASIAAVLTWDDPIAMPSGGLASFSVGLLLVLPAARNRKVILTLAIVCAIASVSWVIVARKT